MIGISQSEAGVAFEDDAQRSRRLSNEFRQIALGSPDFAHHVRANATKPADPAR